MSKTCLVCLECDDKVVIKENVYDCQCKFEIHPKCFEEYKKKFNTCMYCRQNVTTTTESPSPSLPDVDVEWYDDNERQCLLQFRRFDDDFMDQWHFFNNFHERMLTPIRIYHTIPQQSPQLFNLRLYRRPFLQPRIRFQYHFSF